MGPNNLVLGRVTVPFALSGLDPLVGREPRPTPRLEAARLAPTLPLRDTHSLLVGEFLL